MDTISFTSVLSVLYALVAVMLIVVLYHLLFIVVDLRKVMRRLEDVTEQVELVIMKPLTVVDQAFNWVMGQVEKKGRKKKKEGSIFEDKKV